MLQMIEKPGDSGSRMERESWFSFLFLLPDSEDDSVQYLASNAVMSKLNFSEKAEIISGLLGINLENDNSEL
jgi:hypothetical protein